MSVPKSINEVQGLSMSFIVDSSLSNRNNTSMGTSPETSDQHLQCSTWDDADVIKKSDLIVLGTGPAGLQAAISAARASIQFL